MNEADWAKFHAEIARLASFFKEAPDNDRKLYFATVQLAEIASFLTFAGVGDALGPTHYLLKAVGGRQLGHGDPLLNLAQWYQGKKKKRPVNETDRRAVTAAIMECFRKSGRSREEAARDTIKVMCLRGCAPERVMQWREEMMAESPAEHLGAFRYRSLTADLDTISPASAKNKAIFLAKSFR